MNFFNTYISPRAKQKICKQLDKGWLNEGEQVKKFEHRLNVLLDLPNVLTVNSCSSALLICLLDIGVAGKEVILPAQTFIATGMAILAAGGIPVFADIDLDTGNISLDSVKKVVTNRTKAIIPVPWAGNPCNLYGINYFANKYNLDVVQDAAHALGAEMHGRSIAQYSHYTCFSFQAIKHLTTGDGGAICTGMPSYTIKQMKWFGLDKAKIARDECNGRLPNVESFGFKWNMNDLSATLGLANLTGYRTRLKRRRKLAKIYDENLKNIPGVYLLNVLPDCESAYWMYTLRVDNRSDFFRKLSDHNLLASTVDYGIHKNPVFNWKAELPNQTIFDKTQISLPLHEGITEENVWRTIDVIKSGW